MNYGTILARLRKDKKLSQPDVSNYISRHSSKAYNRAMVSHWENGVSLPPVEQFLLMCELYGVTDIQKTFRGIDTDISEYHKLNSLGKSRADEYISMLNGNPTFREPFDSVVEEPKPRYMNLYDLPAAAGFGNYLDNVSYEEIEVDVNVPDNADFAIRVSGDSMIPRFVDKQIVFIKKQQTLNIGEFGIFVLNGDSFIKKFGQKELISLNPIYEPIPIKELDSFHIFGKVVGG
jgi:SOS-response transcriptional repressor LexA